MASHFDQDDIELISGTLTAVWSGLSLQEKTRIKKSVVTDRIMEAVAQGERDAERLKAAGLSAKVLSFSKR